MLIVECFHRWQAIFDGAEAVDEVRFTGPDGRECRRPVFCHQPANFTYDDHGYETISPASDNTVWAVRFTPDQPGEWRYACLCGKRVMQAGAFMHLMPVSGHG